MGGQNSRVDLRQLNLVGSPLGMVNPSKDKPNAKPINFDLPIPSAITKPTSTTK